MKKLTFVGGMIGFCLITAVAEYSAADAAETISYSYDALGRLVLVTHSGSVNNGQVSNYSYDLTDNRTNVTVTGK